MLFRLKMRNSLGVNLALYWRDADASWRSTAVQSIGGTPGGVPVRIPAPARLVACKGTLGAPGGCGAQPPAAEDLAYLSLDQPVLQLGRLYEVPLHAGAFHSPAIVIAVDATTGIPTSIEVSQKAAAASGLSGAAKDATTQLVALSGQISAAKLARTQAKSSQVSADAALQTAQVNGSVAAQLGALGAQTSVATAELALINAKAALATASAVQ